VNHEQQTFGQRFTDHDLHGSIRVACVFQEQQRVQEHFAGALEGNAVFPQIRPGFFLVPFENQAAE
jgi:hypothetical protein